MVVSTSFSFDFDFYSDFCEVDRTPGQSEPLYPPRLDCARLGWIGLDWIGLDWIGLLPTLHGVQSSSTIKMAMTGTQFRFKWSSRRHFRVDLFWLGRTPAQQSTIKYEHQCQSASISMGFNLNLLYQGAQSASNDRIGVEFTANLTLHGQGAARPYRTRQSASNCNCNCNCN
jgi:hypothetical protein